MRLQTSGSITFDTSSLAAAVLAELQPVLDDIRRAASGRPVPIEDGIEAVRTHCPRLLSADGAHGLLTALAEAGYHLIQQPVAEPGRHARDLAEMWEGTA